VATFLVTTDPISDFAIVQYNKVSDDIQKIITLALKIRANRLSDQRDHLINWVGLAEKRRYEVKRNSSIYLIRINYGTKDSNQCTPFFLSFRLSLPSLLSFSIFLALGGDKERR